MKNIRVLTLEDDLQTVQKIFEVLKEIEEDKFSFSVTVLPDYIQVEEFINKNPQIKFDLVLLDRDCFLGGSFHVVNLDHYDKDKVISISSVHQYNLDAQNMGIKRVVFKDYQKIENFGLRLKREILKIISNISFPKNAQGVRSQTEESNYSDQMAFKATREALSQLRKAKLNDNNG